METEGYAGVGDMPDSIMQAVTHTTESLTCCRAAGNTSCNNLEVKFVCMRGGSFWFGPLGMGEVGGGGEERNEGAGGEDKRRV